MDIYLDKDNNPHILITCGLAINNPIDCIIDTGFAGGVALPKYYMSLLKNKDKSVLAVQRYELADGTGANFDIYKLKAKYGKRSKQVSVLFTESQIGLVGIEFLNGFTFTLDLKKKSVSLI